MGKTLKLYKKKKYRKNHPSIKEIIKDDSYDRVVFNIRFPKDEYIDGRPAYLFGDGMFIEEFRVENGHIIHYDEKGKVTGNEPVISMEKWVEITEDGKTYKGLVLIGEKETKK